MKEKIKLHFERIQTRNDITRNYSQAAVMTLTVTGEGATAKKNTEDTGTRSEKATLLISANGEHRKVTYIFIIQNICIIVFL